MDRRIGIPDLARSSLRLMSPPMMMVSLWFGVGSLVTASFVGFVWASMLTSYHRSWTLHKSYVTARWTYRGVFNGIIGSLVDGFAPWYALFTRPPNHFIVVQKDTT